MNVPSDRTPEKVEGGAATATPPLARELYGDILPDPLQDPLPDGQRPDFASTHSAIPPRERDDELLTDLPPAHYNRGRLGGYAAGSRMRLVFGALIVVLVIAGVLVVSWWARTRPPAHPQQFQLPAGTDLAARPRVMAWSGGKARLGLDRQPPGILAIELPDRTLRLAEGSDQAQLKLEVRDGKTVELKVLFGAVVEELGADAQPLLGK